MPSRPDIPVPRRGDVWLVRADKVRPAVVLTRDPMGRFLHRVIVGPITSTVRGLHTEVAVGPTDGVRSPSVVNLDDLRPVDRMRMIRRVGRVRPDTMDVICAAAAYALGCRI